MPSDHKMKTDESNILIVDKRGRIKFFTSGEVKAGRARADGIICEWSTDKRPVQEQFENITA